MIIDCHVHAGELNKHYPIWWIEELYRVWGGVHQWTYDRPTMSVGERLVYQMDQIGIDMMCITTSEHRRVYPNDLRQPPIVSRFGENIRCRHTCIKQLTRQAPAARAGRRAAAAARRRQRVELA